MLKVNSFLEVENEEETWRLVPLVELVGTQSSWQVQQEQHKVTLPKSVTVRNISSVSVLSPILLWFSPKSFAQPLLIYPAPTTSCTKEVTNGDSLDAISHCH